MGVVFVELEVGSGGAGHFSVGRTPCRAIFVFVFSRVKSSLMEAACAQTKRASMGC